MNEREESFILEESTSYSHCSNLIQVLHSSRSSVVNALDCHPASYGAGMTRYDWPNHPAANHPASVPMVFPGSVHHVPHSSNHHHFGPIAGAGPITSPAAPIHTPVAWQRSSEVGLHTDSGMLHHHRGQGQSVHVQPTGLDQHVISNASLDHLLSLLPVPLQRHVVHHPRFSDVYHTPILTDLNTVSPTDGRLQHDVRGRAISQDGSEPTNWPMDGRIHLSERRNRVSNVTSTSPESQNSEAANRLTSSSNRIYRSLRSNHVPDAASESSNQPTSNRMQRSQGRNQVPATASRRRESQQNIGSVNRPARSSRIYQSQRRIRNHVPVDNLSYIRSQMVREVAIMEEYMNAENLYDHPRDMGLDTESISYEALLALGEEIGVVSTGVTEEDIMCHLKTKRYSSSGATSNQEESQSPCTICQDEYEDNDMLGSLECGHEYHQDCLKKWLLMKNVCPLCKSTALVLPWKDNRS